MVAYPYVGVSRVTIRLQFTRIAAQDLGDRGSEVVVTDLAGRHPAQRVESVDVALEERLLSEGGEDPVDRFPGVGQADANR